MSYYEPSSLYALQEEKNYLDSLGDGDSGVENDWWGLFKTCQVRRQRERERGTAFTTAGTGTMNVDNYFLSRTVS